MIDSFELWCWRLLKAPWTARSSNQSILKDINPEYSFGELMLKLKLQYFGNWCEERLVGKDPDAGKDWRQEENTATEDEMVGWHHWLNGHEFEQTPGDGGQGGLECCSPWDCRVRHNLDTERQVVESETLFDSYRGNKICIYWLWKEKLEMNGLVQTRCSESWPASALCHILDLSTRELKARWRMFTWIVLEHQISQGHFKKYFKNQAATFYLIFFYIQQEYKIPKSKNKNAFRKY